MPNYQPVILTGQQAIARGVEYWRVTESRRKPYCLWDMKGEEQERALEFCLGQALACAFWVDKGGQPAAMSWLSPLSLCPAGIDPESAAIHFHFCKNMGAAALAMGRAWIEVMPVAVALGLIPQPWRHARYFALRLGAKLLQLLPGACYLARQNKTVPGYLFTIERPQPAPV